MPSRYSDNDKERALQTLQSIEETIVRLIEWNRGVESSDFYYETQAGMQLLAADCTLLTAVGEGVNRVNRVLPGFLETTYPEIPWRAIIGMRNHIAHGYFELDADLLFDAVTEDLPPLRDVIVLAIAKLME